MLVYQAFRYELAVTPAQRAVLANHAGAARWARNWGLSVRRKAWRRRGEALNAMALHRLLVQLKRTPRGAARPGPRVRQLLARPPHRPASGTTEVQEAGPLRGPVPADRRDPGTVRLGGPAAYWSGGHEGADRQVPRADPIGDLLPGG